MSELRISRRSLLAVMGASTVGAATSASADSTGSAVWGLYQYDRTNTGNARGVQGPAGTAGARWGHTEGEAFTTTPVVTGDTVFAVDQGDGAVLAFDRSTGEQRWRVGSTVGTTRMTYTDGMLLVPSETLVARSPRDGSKQWSADVSSATGVTVKRDYAYVTADTGVYRVSLSRNEVDWYSDEVNQLAPSVAVATNYVYAAGRRYGQVVALDPATGGRRWLARVDGNTTGAPTKVDGARPVLAPTDSALTAISNESGLTKWTFEEGISSSVAVADGTVYATTTGGEVVALAVDSGDEHWRTSAVTSTNPPVLAGGLLYVTGDDGTIAALSPNSGSVAWQSTVGGPRSSNVAVAGGELYVGDEQGTLVAAAEGASGGLRTATPSPTPTEPPTDTPTPTESPEDDDETEPPTSTGSPGFGLGAGAAAVGGGALAARRWLADDGDDD
jgi:outer membrane protein assembly factor BamB